MDYSAGRQINCAAVVPSLELLHRLGAGKVADFGRSVNVNVFPFALFGFRGAEISQYSGDIGAVLADGVEAWARCEFVFGILRRDGAEELVAKLELGV